VGRRLRVPHGLVVTDRDGRALLRLGRPWRRRVDPDGTDRGAAEQPDRAQQVAGQQPDGGRPVPSGTASPGTGPLVDRDGRLVGAFQPPPSVLDPLTGLLGPERMEAAVARELELVRRGGPSGCLALLDMDDLKVINETYGNAAGDSVLVATADVLRKTLRTTDLPLRIGGDEFAVLLPQTTIAAARETLQRVCDAIAAEVRVLGRPSEAGGTDPAGGTDRVDGVDPADEAGEAGEDRETTPAADRSATVSVGIAQIDERQGSVHGVVSAAQSAAFAAKARARGGVVVAHRSLFADLRREHRELWAAVTEDARTGIASARRYADDVAELHDAAAAAGTAYGLLLIDIDHFHAYNRAHGQLAGHETLRRVAQTIQEVASPGRAYRYGGEEFTVLLAAPATVDELHRTGRAIVDAVRELGIEHADRPDATDVVTVTAAGTLGPGQLEVTGGDTSTTDPVPSPDDVFDRADQALIDGKSAGRDRYVPATEEPR
jgi:diguanylate cyclase (GGDEF)-like protein